MDLAARQADGAMTSRVRKRHHLVLLIAILAFSISLLVGFGRLLVESDRSRSETQELVYWSASQLLYEYWRFVDTFDRYAIGAPDMEHDDVLNRLDILWSRINVYEGGGIADRLAEVERSGEVVAALAATLEAVEPTIRALDKGGGDEYEYLRRQIIAHSLPLYRLAQRTNIYEQGQAIDFRLDTANTYWLLTAFLVGILLTGAVLIVLLIRETRTANESLLAASDAERLARTTADHLTAVLDNAVSAIITIDDQGIVSAFNPAAEKLFGLPPAEIIGKNVSVIMPEPYRSDHDGYMADYVGGGAARVIGRIREVEARRRDGGIFPVELSVGEMWSEGRRYFVGVIADITKRREAEEELRQSQKMEAIGALTGGVAHEFNNLLTAIGGFAHMAARKTDDVERTRQCLDEIVKASDQAAELTSQMLSFARKQVLRPKVIDVNAVLNDAATMVGPLAGATISLRMDASDRDLFARADPAQLTQGILNLAINGCHAMGGGGELVIGSRVTPLSTELAARHPEAAAGEYAAIFVRDSGTGIDDETLKHIFDPFFTTKEEGKGTGLGLSMVCGMVEQSGGFIDVTTEIGAGTTFTIYLPCVEAQAEAQTGPQAQAHLASGGGTILIAEDKKAVRELARITLEEIGYEVLAGADGEEALALYLAYPGTIDVLLSDVSMAGIDGPELAKRLVAAQPDIKIAFMSGHRASANLQRDNIGADSIFIQKPFDPDDLVRRIGELIEERAAPKTTADTPSAKHPPSPAAAGGTI